MSCEMPMLMYWVYARLTCSAMRFFTRFRSALICWFWGVEKQGRVLFAGPVFIRTRKRYTIVLGDGVLFNSKIRENALCRGPSVMDTRWGGMIRIGDKSGLSSAVLSSKSSISIGTHCFIGANVQIYDHDFHPLNPDERRGAKSGTGARTKPVVIGDDVFIGAGSILLKGTRIGARSIIAAGSVIFGLDIPPDSLVKGNPAEIVGKNDKP